MRKGALALASVVALASSAACGRPVDRECRVLLPRLAEADESTATLGNARGDVTRVYARQATRSAAAARWLHHTTVSTPSLEQAIPPLVQALERHADTAHRADAAIQALGLHPVDGGTGAWPALAGLFTPESTGRPRYLDDIVALNNRCGFFYSAAPATHPDCVALDALASRFLEPAADATAATHLADRLTELAAIHSPDARAESAIRFGESVARDVGGALVAMMPSAPAAAVIEKLRTAMLAMTVHRQAGEEVTHASEAARVLCRGE